MARKSSSSPKPFDELTKEERGAWRALPATRAFRAHIAAIKREVVEALLVAAEKEQGAPSLAGFIRACERIDRELLADPTAAKQAADEPFIDEALQ